MIQQRFPVSETVATAALLAELCVPLDAPLRIGDQRILDFLTELSLRLRAPSVVRRLPELGPLSIYLRPTHLMAELARLTDTHEVLHVPRGLVFHVAPSNADTVFVYSWALAALSGNRNLVRISTRAGETTEAIIGIMTDMVRQTDPIVAQTQRLLSFEHDDETTAAISSACDLRVLWGGDQAIADIRRAPLSPAARDLTFPNRSSFAAISATAFLAASAQERRRAVEAFFNDGYLFGQAACASPGTVFWVGPPDLTSQAQALFWSQLHLVIEARGFSIDATMAIQKRVATYGLAAEGRATQLAYYGNEVAVATLDSTAALPRRWLGTGTFPQKQVSDLDDIAPCIQRQDQTLAYYGFSAAEMQRFARRLAGRGLDRIVPLGQALGFASIWDGYDLLREFTRLVTIH
jgi:hypothetical protein